MRRRAGLLAATALLAVAVPAQVAPTAQTAPATTACPGLGVLQPRTADATTYKRAGLTRVVVSVAWSRLEPRRGSVDAAYAGQVRQQVRTYRAAGLQVVLDPGVQYPPAWVFGLPGQTRFVNQHGDVWRAGVSQDLPNAVFNTAVRRAVGQHLDRLGSIPGVSAVRVGGLLSGELRYPPADFRGRTGSLWMYDPGAQAISTVPGWRPGDGGGKAKEALRFYSAALAGYEAFQLRHLRAAFPRAELQLLLPSFGLRPGMRESAVADDLRGRTSAERNDLVASGLDWERQLDVLRAVRRPVTAYSTWLDAPTQGRGVTGVDPATWIAYLARPRGLPVAGENTGGGGPERLALSLRRAKALRLTSITWMSAPALRTGPVTLGQLGREHAATFRPCT